MLILSRLCRVHKGHVGKVLNKWRNTQQWLDESMYDIASGVDDSLHKIRLQKDSLSRELINAENDIINLFSEEQIQMLLGNSKRQSQDSNVELEVKSTREVLKFFRILRPNSPPSYRELSASYLHSKSSELIKKHTKNEDDHDNFTTDSFILSIISLCKSLESDIKQLGLPIADASDSLFGLPETINNILDYVKLEKTIEDSKRWSNEIWPNLSKFFNISFSTEEMSDWLQSHMTRINNNGKTDSKYYSIAEDFNKDTAITSEVLEEENAMGIPPEKYEVYFKSLISLLNHNMTSEEVDKLTVLFKDLLATLEDIGLRDWIGKDISLDSIKPLPDFSAVGEFTNNDIYEASQLVKNIARGDNRFAASFPSPDEIIQSTYRIERPENKHLSDVQIDEMFNKDGVAIPSTGLKDTPIDLMYENHLRFHRSLGPAEYFLNDKNEPDWRWKPPAGAIYDQHRGIYLKANRKIDVMLRLDKLRCVIVDRRQTLSMSKGGRIYFTRCVVAVGDGKGYFGMGVGHGANIADARNDAILNALKDMYFIDFDKKSTLLTPVRGTEYGASITISPRPLGKGLRISGRYLALAYLTGLEDCKIRFSGTRSWVTRMRALRRALEQIYSRTTMANATGQKYVNLFCPGDHTIHWPDRWFVPILNEYKNKIRNIKQIRLKSARKSARRCMAEITPADLRTGAPNYAYKSPLQKWQMQLIQMKYNKSNVETDSTAPKTESVAHDTISPSEDELNYPIDRLLM